LVLVVTGQGPSSAALVALAYETGLITPGESE
jgi:hypothetical protein